jgi:hypothetical protein
MVRCLVVVASGGSALGPPDLRFGAIFFELSRMTAEGYGRTELSLPEAVRLRDGDCLDLANRKLTVFPNSAPALCLHMGLPELK